MSAVIHYLPTANITPLPRKPHRGRLPKGIARFSTYRKKRDEAAAAAAARNRELEVRRNERLHYMATLVHERALRNGFECSFEYALESCRKALGYWDPRGAA